MKEKRGSIPDRTVWSALFSNLGKAAEKQQRTGESELFFRLAEEFAPTPAAGRAGFREFREQTAADLADLYPAIRKSAEACGDRGTLRALKWGEKVAAIQKSLTGRYVSKGDVLLENRELFICEACGFIFAGDGAPEICPVCKAPKSRFAAIS